MRKDSRFAKRSLCGAIMGLTLFLTACGGGTRQEKNTDTAGEAREYVYVPEYLNFDQGEEGGWFGNMQLVEDDLYYQLYAWNEEAQQSSEQVVKYNFTKGEVQLVLELVDAPSINHFTLDPERNLYLLSSLWEYDETTDHDNSTYFLTKYSAGGEEVYQVDITEVLTQDEENSYVQNMVVDGQGRIYASSDNLVYLFDELGQYAGDIKVDTNWINTLCAGGDDKVYLTYWDYTGNGSEILLAEVDFDGKKVGNTYRNLPRGNWISPTNETTFLTGDSTTLYRYDREANEYESVLNWLDSDINGDYVSLMSEVSEEQLLVVTNDWSTNKTELIRLTKTDPAKIDQRTELTLATLYQNQSLQTAAVAFNKSHPDCRINIKYYMDVNNWSETSYQDAITKMNNDLTSGGNAPDLIDLSVVDEAQLVGKNALEDLTAYLAKSSSLSEASFDADLLEKFKVDGVLTGIPRTVQMSTFVGKTSVVGDGAGWTLSDMVQMADAYPEAEIFNGATQTQMLYYFLLLNEDAFIDWKSGKCSFDSPEFIQMLEFVNRFPEEFDWENYDGSVSRMQENKVLLDSAYISDFNEIQIYEARFGEPVNFIGFPTVDGSAGHAMSAEGRYGILSASDNKEAAWNFIESYLTAESGFSDWGLYTLKEKLEEQIKEATEVEYIRDENGEILLDENGEPMTMGGGGISMDGWEYTYHTPTEEDVEQVLDILKKAKPITEGFDQSIIGIIQEEAEAFFQGQKSAEDVAGIIQNRLQNYVNENM